MYLRWWRRFLCLFLFSSAVVSLHSQTAAPDSGNAVTIIKTKVPLVLLDVVVTDGKGDAVSGLHKEDFEVLEDGKPQTISNFEEHRGAPPTQIKLPPMPPHVYTNFPVMQAADSVNVLLLDALNTPSRDQTYVHSQMLQYLKKIPPGTRVAIFTLASQLRMLQGVTTDSSELLAVLNSHKAGIHPSSLLPSGAETEANQQTIDFMIANGNPQGAAQSMAQAAVDPVSAMKQFMTDTAAFQTEARVRLTLQALQQLARYLSGVPGRKNVIWFSGSFPLGILPDSGLPSADAPNSDVPDPFRATSSFQQDVRKTTDLLTASQVALYPIAAEGLAADSAFEVNGQEISEKRGSAQTQDRIQQLRTGGADRDSNHSAMEELAKETGGQAFYNTNGLNTALARVINAGTHYYSLSYAPSNAAMDGKFRRIQLKLLSGKHTLAYRRGYFADDLGTALAKGQTATSDPLLPLMGRNLPDYTQILYKVLVQPSAPQPPPDAPRAGSNIELKGPFTRYGVDFAISVEDLKLEPAPDGSHHGTMEVVLVAYDREGKPLNLVVTKGDMLLQAKEYVAAQRGGLQIHKEIDVPKQDIYLRTGIYDLKSNTAGTLGMNLSDVTVPAGK